MWMVCLSNEQKTRRMVTLQTAPVHASQTVPLPSAPGVGLTCPNRSTRLDTQELKGVDAPPQVRGVPEDELQQEGEPQASGRFAFGAGQGFGAANGAAAAASSRCAKSACRLLNPPHFSSHPSPLQFYLQRPSGTTEAPTL